MNDNIILDPAERDYAELKSGIDALLESTKRAIREQERIARQADAAVARLEAQLDKLESFKNA
tara:strand:- start:246 stop:434 length:189 start_codon:yes stop_codon:yes gene_type:complete